MEKTFDEKLTGHLDTLRSVLLEEHKTIVFKVLHACECEGSAVKCEVEADGKDHPVKYESEIDSQKDEMICAHEFYSERFDVKDSAQDESEKDGVTCTQEEYADRFDVKASVDYAAKFDVKASVGYDAVTSLDDVAVHIASAEYDPHLLTNITKIPPVCGQMPPTADSRPLVSTTQIPNARRTTTRIPNARRSCVYTSQNPCAVDSRTWMCTTQNPFAATARSWASTTKSPWGTDASTRVSRISSSQSLAEETYKRAKKLKTLVKADVFGLHTEDLCEEMIQRVNNRASQDMEESWAKNMQRKCQDFWSVVSAEILCSFCMNMMVFSNIIVLGFQAGSTWEGWLIVDSLYAFVYTVEVVVRLALQGVHLLNPRSSEFKWIVFDIVLACLAIFDVVVSYLSSKGSDSNYSFLRIARLVRIARMLRLFQLDMFKDLILMINGAVGGLRTLGWSIVMIIVPLYTFALFYTEMIGLRATHLKEDVSPNFNSIGMSMFTGFNCLVVGDCAALNGTPIFPHLVHQYGWAYGVVYALTSVCMTFGLFNVIVAIYVENTVTAAKSNELLQRQRRLEDQSRFAEKILNLVHFLWTQLHRNSTVEFVLDDALEMEVSEEIFRRLLNRPEMLRMLADLDVPIEDHKDLFEICDADGSGVVTMSELIAGVRKLRGDPRRSDLVYVMLRINQLLTEVHVMRENTLDVSESHVADEADPESPKVRSSFSL